MHDIPSTLPTGTRRQLPWGRFTTVYQVPLVTHEQGEKHEGFLRVPSRLALTQAHTNERLEFDQYVGKHLADWIRWKDKQGYSIEGTPKVTGPFEPPTPRPGEDPEDEGVRYKVVATFRRRIPRYVSLDDFLGIKDQADLYGVDLNAPRMTETPIAKPVKHIIPTGPAHDPMRFAEERRKALGLKREDLIIPEMWERED